MAICIALLRGINVGKANRIPMAALKQLVAGLGFDEVRTLLNGGNVVFNAGAYKPVAAASAIENLIKNEFGFDVPVIVVSVAPPERSSQHETGPPCSSCME